MKKTTTALLIALSVLCSCNKTDVPEQNNVNRATLQLQVRTDKKKDPKTLQQTRSTQGPINSTTLPDGSQIGIFLTDRAGMTYMGTTDNMKYTASGTGATQTWDSATPAVLGTTDAQLLAYYPYNEDVTDITAVPIETATQTDYLWARPCRWLNYALYTAELKMEHSMALIRINFIKDASYTSTATVTEVSMTSDGTATGALLDATDGTLRSFTGIGTEIQLQKEQDPLIWSTMSIPTGGNNNTTIKATIDGTRYETALTAAYTQGSITTITLTVKGTQMSVLKTEVIPWSNIDLGQGDTDGAYRPKLTITGNTENIIYKTSYENDSYTIKAAALNGTVNAVSLSSGRATMEQSVDGNGIRTITLTDIQSDITLSFSGTSYLEWVRIQHVDGTLYTAEEWLAAEAAGTVTDADANGVAVKYSKWTSCPHVIHPKYSTSTMKWSSNASVTVSGVYTTTDYSNSDKTSCNYDIAGKANTDALLAAVSAGTIADAPAAQWASQVVFADGSQGYLPAAGEVWAWADNKTAINACMDAIGGDQVGVSTWNYIWTSTQYSSSGAWYWNYLTNYVFYGKRNDSIYVRAVCAFAYDPANEYANK